MTTTLQDLVNDLNDRLDDAPNVKVGAVAKIRFLNHGIAATWPDLYRIVTSSIDVTETINEYSLTALSGLNAKIMRIEVDPSVAGSYIDAWDTSIVPSATAPLLVFRGGVPAATGRHIRVTAGVELTKLVDLTDAYDGPLGTEELPVLYAMALSVSRPVESRLDYRRYSTTTGQNGVGVAELTGVAGFWMDQYDRLLERKRMPLLGMPG